MELKRLFDNVKLEVSSVELSVLDSILKARLLTPITPQNRLQIIDVLAIPCLASVDCKLQRVEEKKNKAGKYKLNLSAQEALALYHLLTIDLPLQLYALMQCLEPQLLRYDHLIILK